MLMLRIWGVGVHKERQTTASVRIAAGDVNAMHTPYDPRDFGVHTFIVSRYDGTEAQITSVSLNVADASITFNPCRNFVQHALR